MRVVSPSRFLVAPFSVTMPYNIVLLIILLLIFYYDLRRCVNATGVGQKTFTSAIINASSAVAGHQRLTSYGNASVSGTVAGEWGVAFRFRRRAQDRSASLVARACDRRCVCTVSRRARVIDPDRGMRSRRYVAFLRNTTSVRVCATRRGDFCTVVVRINYTLYYYGVVRGTVIKKKNCYNLLFIFLLNIPSTSQLLDIACRYHG